MALSNDLISQFVKVTRDNEQTKNESTAYGKIVKQGDTEYVQLDGSDLLTPISSTTVVKDGDRVMVTIKNHTAIVTGDFTNQSASNKDVVEIGNKITEFEIVIADKIVTQDLEAINAYIENIKGITAKYEELTAVTAEIETLQAKYANMEHITATDITAINAEIESIRGKFADFTNISAEDLTAINAELTNLIAYNATFSYVSADKIEAIDANIRNLDADKLSAKEAELKYANIDFSNIGEAAIENLFSDSGIIKDLIMSDGKVTGELVGVTIKGDLIEGNTVKADKLVILGEDGLYYKLNVNALGEATASSDEKYQNGLDGSIIVAESITAEKIAVDDLVAFGATIGGYHITEDSLYSGVKNSVSNTTQGVFLGDDGQMAVGNANNYLKFFIDEDGQYKLEISATSLKLSSSDSSLEDVMNDAIIDSVEEFYMSTSPTVLDGGSWSTSQPEWIQGMYIWRRTYITKGDGTTSYQPSEIGVCITGNSSEPVLIKDFDGKNIQLTDSSDYEVVDIMVHGETSQEVRSGKNKFNFANIKLYDGSDSYGSATSVIDTGIRIKNVNFAITNSSDFVKDFKPSTSYICTAKVKVLSKPDGIRTGATKDIIRLSNTSNSVQTSVLYNADKNKWLEGEIYECVCEFDTPENVSGCCFYAYTYIDNSTSRPVGEFEISELMIREATVTDDTFELYGKSPSLDQPSTINNIVGDININITNDSDLEQTISFPLGETVLMEGSYLSDDGIHHKRRRLTLPIADMNNTNESNPGWTGLTQLVNDFPSKVVYLSSVTKYISNISLFPGKDIYINTISNGKLLLGDMNTGSELTQTEYKTLYPDLVVEIEYEIPTEEIIPYTDEQLLAWNKMVGMSTYNPITNITSDAKLTGQYYTYFKGEPGKTGESANTGVLEERLAQAESTIELLSNMIANLVTDENGGSLMTQTPDGWTFNMSSISGNLNAIKDAMTNMENDHAESNSALDKLTDLVNNVANKTAYITMSTDDNGDPCIELGKSDNVFKVRITNTAIDFLEGSTKIAYANNNTFYSETIIVKKQLQIGEGPGFVWRTRANGNMGLTYISG